MKERFGTYCFICSLVFIVGMVSTVKAQDTTLQLDINTSLLRYRLPDSMFYTRASLKLGFGSIHHSPEKKDHRNVSQYGYLLKQKPNSKNYKKYYDLAVSLWELERTAEAEQLFLSIISSQEIFYTGTYYNNSDIPGDTSTNIYGYGSFTSNYKNYAAKYLVKIYLEQKQYDTALQYLEDVIYKYKVTYNCGTGYNFQQNEYKFLYASCYLGQKEYRKVIDLLLPACLDNTDDMLIEAIKNTWTAKEIEEYLTVAEASISCELDSFPSYSYRTHYPSKGDAYSDTIHYYSGKAAILLFNQLINMPVPDLNDGEHLTREHFISDFKRSYLYIMLANRAAAGVDDSVKHIGPGREEEQLSENNRTQLSGEFYFHLF